MRYRIVYIMNVDWCWAKQRPHFLAQLLSRSHDVVVVYPYAWRRRHLACNDCHGVRLFPFFRLPFGGRYDFVGGLNVVIYRMITRLLLKWHQPDIVWISSPELFDYLPKNISVRLIYDCMDDVLAFPRNAPRRNLLAASEDRLINACSRVICSSVNLRDKLIARSGHPEKYAIVHNALDTSDFSAVSVGAEMKNRKERNVLGYVGTISSWLDFDAVLKVVNTFPSLEIHLVGPVDKLGEDFPQHDRIKYIGAVRHGDIQTLISGFDILLMPFLVTELILSVDPVKLYEYVYFNKPIVAVRYPEIERFSGFVDFYSNHEELISIINIYISGKFIKKYSDDDRARFVNDNLWSKRISYIEENILE